MKAKLWTALVMLLVSIPGFADEGLHFQCTLTEKVFDEDITTSDFEFLVHFGNKTMAR